MKKTRFIQLFVVLFGLGPLLSTGMSACALCPTGPMQMAQGTAAMPSCHTTAAQAKASGPVQLATACCCAELTCADQAMPVSTGPAVEGLTVPALGLVLHTVLRDLRAPVAPASGWVRTDTPRTAAVPLYQLKRSLLI